MDQKNNILSEKVKNQTFLFLLEKIERFPIVRLFLVFKSNLMLLACHKPTWISSFDVVKIIRTHFQDKVGHSGTLDPMASGLMILGVGKGTKQLTQLIGMDKSYETTIDFSLLTDTRDASFWEKEEHRVFFELEGMPEL